MDSIDYDLILQFVLDAEEANLFSESLTFEAKERRNQNNVVEAVAALSNTDGGVVLVGVKDKGASGAGRLVGVPQAEHDPIVSQLHNLIPTAMPAVVAVRVPQTDRLVIVLRIDADAVPHPVMVAGKVLYRVPGHTVPADRQRLLDLVERDKSGIQLGQISGALNVPIYPWQPGHIPLWPEDGPSGHPERESGQLRIVGGLTLPPRITDRPWIDTRARQALVDVLNSSPLRTGPAWHLQTWQIIEARATTLDLRAGRAELGAIELEAAAHLSLARRSLSLLVALRWVRVGEEPMRFPLPAFYWALLACLVTVASANRHVARSLDAAEPTDIRPWEAWLRSSTRDAFDVVDVRQFWRDSPDKPEGANFPSARTPTTDITDLDQLARNWLTYWMLDIGARDFERWLAREPRPDWLRPPDVALPQ